MRPVATSLATLLCTMAVNAYGGFCGGALNVNTGQGFAAIPNAKAVWTPNNGDITIRRKISTQSSLFDCTDACWNRDSLDTSKRCVAAMYDQGKTGDNCEFYYGQGMFHHLKANGPGAGSSWVVARMKVCGDGDWVDGESLDRCHIPMD